MIYEQKGSTCGIYAFVNGLTALSKKTISPTELASNVEALVSKTSYTANPLRGETLLGEFFDAQTLASFLNHHEHELTSELGLPHFQATVLPFERITLKNNDCFYLIPGCCRKKYIPFSTYAILHWVTLLPNELILNSAKGTQEQWSEEKRRTFHTNLINRSFSWTKWRRQNTMDIADEFITVPTSRQLVALSNEAPNFHCTVPYEVGYVVQITPTY